MPRTERRHHSPEEKVKVLRLHLLEHKPVSELCEQFAIHPTLFYQWQKQFFEKGTATFAPATESKALAAAQERTRLVEAKLQRKHEVLSELMEEYIQLKKELGES